MDVLFVDFTDPLAPEGLNDSDRTVAGLPNFNVSPTFKPFSWLTTYFTYNYSQSTGVANGGGYAATGGRFSSDYFHRESELFEVGAKSSLLKDTLFLNAAAFYQTRNVPIQGGTADELTVRGFELEAYYQPSKDFYLFAGYTFLDAIFKDQIPFTVQTEPFDQLSVPGLTDTFGVVGPLTRGDFEAPGLPDHLINGLISYKHQVGPGKLGATLGAVITSQQNLNYGGSVVIPWQYSLDASIFYELKSVEMRFAVLNFTDETNFSPPNSVYGSDSVVVDPGARLKLRSESSGEPPDASAPTAPASGGCGCLDLRASDDDFGSRASESEGRHRDHVREGKDTGDEPGEFQYWAERENLTRSFPSHCPPRCLGKRRGGDRHGHGDGDGSCSGFGHGGWTRRPL